MAQTWYKKMILLAGGMSAAGTLWYARDYKTPAGIDYAEVAGATIEHAWLTERGNSTDWCDAMTNWMGRTAMRPTWAWFGGTLPYMLCDVYNISPVTSSATPMWYYSLYSYEAADILKEDGVPFYRRATDGRSQPVAAWAMLYPASDTAMLWPENDWSSVSNGTRYSATYATEPSNYGFTNSLRKLESFAYQTNKWRGLVSADLDTLSAPLRRMQNVMWIGAPPSGGIEVKHYEEWIGTSNYTGAATTFDQTFAQTLANGAYNAMTKVSDSVTTNDIGLYKQQGVRIESNAFGGIFDDGFGVKTQGVANLIMQWSEYSDVSFDWPCQFAFTTGLVETAYVSTMAAFDVDIPIKTKTGSTTDPSSVVWDKQNTAIVRNPTLRIENETTYAGTRNVNMEIYENYTKWKGNVQTNMSLSFTCAAPTFPTDFYLIRDTPSGIFTELYEWNCQRYSGFTFVVFPKVKWEYLQ